MAPVSHQDLPLSATARLPVISTLHHQVGEMAFSTLPENKVKVTAGATGSYLVKAAMLNLGQGRVLPSGAARRGKHSPQAARSRTTQGSRTAAPV